MRKTGLTNQTVERLMLDSGVVYLNYDSPTKRTKLGACRGGNEFSVTAEMRDMPFDGAGGLVQGARRIISTTATLTVNLVEISKEILKIAIPGAEYTNVGAAKDEAGTAITGETYYEIKRAIEKTIPDFEFTDVAIVAEMSGTKAPVICCLKNAMAGGELNLSFSDADESVLKITFTGSISPDALEDEPWFIRLPEKTGTV